ncbi:MAG: hypothetical protein EOO74_11495 [Myxococcales bacterium]|nr:MAG: hypothetical protein EOO74_11495 [Myxococcales bacterium]
MHLASPTAATTIRYAHCYLPFWGVLSADPLGDRLVAEMKVKDTERRLARTRSDAQREEARKKQLAAFAETPVVVMGERQQRRLEERQWVKRTEQAKRAAARGPVVPTTLNRHERRRAVCLARKPTT